MRRPCVCLLFGKPPPGAAHSLMEQQVCDEPHADEQTKAEDYGNAAQKDTWQRYLCTVAWLRLFTAN